MNAAEIGSDYVGQVVDRRFALLEWLGNSGNSGAFLTELQGQGSQKAAIKLILAVDDKDDRRLAAWAASESLSHPHLVKVFHFGQAQVNGVDVVYVVTEYAEEVLSQIIPERALTPEETREMLNPVINALSYLHAKGFVHGHLKASNIMVVDNQLKLSTDGLLEAGAVQNRKLTQSTLDAPLNASGTITPAADVWSLGMTVVEALTQRPPIWGRSSDQGPIVPDALPQPFVEIARKCLQLDPGRRCSLSDVKSLLGGEIGAYHEPVQHHRPGDTHKFSKLAPTKVPVVPMMIVLLVLIGIIAALTLHFHKQPSPAPASSATPEAAAPPSALTEKGAVTNRVLPDVPRNVSASIHGTVHVAVRVKVDTSGEVSDSTLVSHGPSKYFARLALESARSWKFKPAESEGHAVPSVWILRYQFRNSGTEVTPLEETP
jgi:TonB family protein